MKKFSKTKLEVQGYPKKESQKNIHGSRGAGGTLQGMPVAAPFCFANPLEFPPQPGTVAVDMHFD